MIKQTNPKLALEIELDPLKLETLGLNLDYVMKGLCDFMKKVGLTENKEQTSNNHIMYVTDGSDKGMAHIMIIVDELSNAQWFKKACLKLDCWQQNEDYTDFLYGGSMIERLKIRGLW